RASAASQLDRASWLGRVDLDVRGELPELVRASVEERERPVVARHAASDAGQLERDRRLLRPPREVVADREDGDVRLVDPPDQLHIREDARIPSEVERRPVLEADDDSARFAG